MFRYKYTPLNASSHEIRLVTILPGRRDDPIRIQITHATLFPPVNKAEAKTTRLPLEEIQKTLPEGWYAKETLEGRILFYDANRQASSWVHPNPDVPHDAYDDVNQEQERRHSELDYEALSYCWGPPRARAKALVIKLDDSTQGYGARLRTRYLPLARNISLAMRDLRYEDRCRVMWIDALCINQADYEERSEQVGLMKDIYPLARRVVVWLGSSFPEDTESLSILRRIGEQIEVGRDFTLLPSPGCEETDWYATDVNLPYEIEQWERVQSFLFTPWFRRMWIVQEIHRGSRSSVLVCGHDELLWSTFRRAILALNRKERSLQPEYLKEPLELCTVVEKASLEQLLFTSRDRECSNKRDKIYGIISLAPPEIAKCIRIDYRQSLLGVYEQVFIKCMEQAQRLTQLRYGGLRHNEATPGWPTWVPEWSQIRIGITIQPTECFRASGISASEFRSYWPGQLEVTALRFAVVSWTFGAVMARYESHFFGVYWMIVEQQERRGYPTGEAFRNVLLRILTVNMVDDRTPGWGYPTLKELSDVVSAAKTDVNEIDWRRKNAEKLAYKRLTGPYRYLLTNTFTQSCVFRTGNGYMGMIRGVPKEGKLPANHVARDVYELTNGFTHI